eukprot:scaffold10618_cov55-Attheya_sp.AAC.3
MGPVWALNRADVAKIVTDLNAYSGKTFGEKEIKALFAYPRLKNHPELLVTTTAIKKTQSRFTAKKSVIGSISLLTVVASTHFIPRSTERSPMTREVMKKVTPGAQRLIALTSKALNDVPLEYIKPQYIFSSDDNVEYVYVGLPNAKDEFWLVAENHSSQAGTLSKYKNDESKTMSGMRVKHSWTFNTVGQCCAPLCVSVCGLTEAELSKELCPSGLLILQIEGLCISGHSLVPMGDTPLPSGYLMPLRNNHDQEQDKKVQMDTTKHPLLTVCGLKPKTAWQLDQRDACF